MAQPALLSLDAQRLLDAVPQLLWVIDATGHLTWGNRAFQEQVRARESALSSPGSPGAFSWLDFVHPDDRSLARTWPLGASGEQEIELRLRASDDDEGRLFRVQARSAPHGADAEPGWLLTATDIEALRAERDERTTLQHIVDASADCIKVLDLDARLLSMNEGGRAVMEVDDFSVCRNLLWPTFWKEDTRHLVEAALDGARAGRTVRFEGATATMKGTMKWWEVTVSPLRDGGGHVTRLLATSRDITERHAAQAANDALRAALEERVHERTQQLGEERTALDAFVEFTEAVGSEADALLLARQATRVVRANLRHLSVAYYEPEHSLWRARVWSDDIAPDVVEQIRAGIPMDAPNFAQAVAQGAPLFVDGWDADANHVASTRDYGAVALLPIFLGGEAKSVLVAGTLQGRTWTEREQAVLRSVGRGLHAALERAEHTAQLQAQHAQLAGYVDQLESRTRALQAFETLSRELSLETDPLVLVRGAQDIVLSLLPDGVATYYELERDPDTWRLRAQTGDVRDDVLQRTLDAGLPYASAGNLRVPHETREAYFQDAYDPDTDQIREATPHIGTSAALPVMVGGEVRGVFGVGLFGAPRPWSPVAKTVLASAVHSLGSALERAEGVARLTEERRKLGLANEELEAFAYSVSHDLRTPLRHVTSFLDLARQALGSSIDPRAGRYLTVAGDAAKRMNTLIDAMLNLSRLGRLPVRVVDVDLDVIVHATRRELEPDVGNRDVRWHVASLPRVKGDPDMLRQVMVNLLSNAVKYTRPRTPAVIEVWAEDRPGEVAVFVRDNGVGFDPRYQAKLFGVFQRLHREDEFEGTGVGLANVRRVISRHGGQVWAERPEGWGALFGFTLPKLPEPSDVRARS